MLLQFMHLGQAALASYGALQSYTAITNLQKYESVSEKLAEWSSEAGKQLHKTRTTQTSGAAAILCSLIAALLLALRGSSYNFFVRLAASPAMAVGVLLAVRHMRSYWTSEGKTEGKRVPLPKMEEYNAALEQTEGLLRVLDWLMFSWAATSVAALIGGY